MNKASAARVRVEDKDWKQNGANKNAAGMGKREILRGLKSLSEVRGWPTPVRIKN